MDETGANETGMPPLVTPQPPEQPDAPRIRPGRWAYVLALAPFAIGAAIGVFSLVSVFESMKAMTDAQRVLAPGSHEITIDAPGEHTIHFEHESVLDGKVYHSPKTPFELTCRLKNKETGQEVNLQAVRTTMTYSIGNRSGRAIWTFHADSAGVYELVAAGNAGPQGQASKVLAIGTGLSPLKMVGGIFGTIGAFGVGFLATAVAIVIVAVKRSRSSRRSQTPASPPPPPQAWSRTSP